MRAGIAYVPEDRLAEGLFLDQSVQRNIVAAHLEPVEGKLGFLRPRRIRQHAELWRAALTLAAPEVSAPVSSLSGGKGSVGGVVTAMIALQMLASGFNMLHFSNFSRDFFWGLFLLLIMVINHYARRRVGFIGHSWNH